MKNLKKLMILVLLSATMMVLFAPPASADTTPCIHFNANGGKGDPSCQHNLPGNSYSQIRQGVPSRAGYIFLGWNLDKKATVATHQPGDLIYLAEKDITLYAIWGKAPVTAATINVVHKDNQTGEILDQDTYSVLPGKYGPYEAEVFTGYCAGKLATGSAAKSGTAKENTIYNITYTYNKYPTITVVHKDNATGAILKQDTYSLAPGKYGPYNAEIFTGYLAGKLVTGSAAASGTLVEGKSITITYGYDKSPTITVVHKDADTGAILREDVYNVNAGSYGTYKPDTFAGYLAGSLAPGSAAASGTIKAGQQLTIIFQYKKSTAVINVIHKDKDSNMILRQDTFTVNAGAYGPYNADAFSGYEPGALALGSAQSSGTVTAGQTITITYLYAKVQTATIRVIHEAWGTLEILRQDTFTVSPGNYGPYLPEAFLGYGAGVLLSGSAPASGVIGAGETRTIYYLYEKVPTTGTVNVVHKDKDTGAVLRQDAYTVPAGNYGPYSAMTFAGYGAGSLAAGSAPASGTVGANQSVTVIYEYAKVPTTGTVNVVHKDKDTGAVLRQDAYTVPAGNYGPYSAMTFAGYGVGSLAAGSASASGTVGANQSVTVIYEYAKTPATATIIVEHRDQDTKAVLRSDTYTVNAGSYGPYSAMSFTGYGAGSWVVSSAPVSGTIAGGQTITITFRYTKTTQAKATINVVHKDSATGAVLSQNSYSVNAGSYGPYSAMTFTGYGAGSLAAGSAPASGTVTAGQTLTITYLYTKTVQAKATVNVVHKDRDTGAILKQDSYEVNEGNYGPYNAMVFTGYGTGSLAAGSAPASGTIGGGQTITITYQYGKSTAKAVINVVHKNRDTGVVLQTDYHTVDPGSYGPYTASTFPGYGPGYLASNSAPASGTVAAGQSLTITYLYTGRATIYVVHKDRTTGAVLKSETFTVNAGAYGPYDAAVIANYGPGTWYSGSAAPSGTVTAGQTITITYLYTRTTQPTATVIVEHRYHFGHGLIETDTFTVNAGAYGPYSGKTISGYVFNSWIASSSPVSGTIKEGETITIIFCYLKPGETLSGGHGIGGASIELDGLELTLDGMAFTLEDEEPTSDESNEVQKEVDRSNTGFEFEDAGFVFEDTGAADTGFVFE